MATNLALQLQVIESDTDLSKVKVGNSIFTDDVWDLSCYSFLSSTPDSMKQINFGNIKNQELKQVIKQYAYYKLGQIKPQSLVTYIAYSMNIIYYCENNNIDTFSKVDKNEYLKLVVYLKDVLNLSKSAGFHTSYIFEDIVKVGQIKNWNVPSGNIFNGCKASQLWHPEKELKTKRTHPIPEEVYNTILYHAINDEEDIITKAEIIIQSQTGLRINEVLSIKENCLHASEQGNYFEVELSKTEKGESILHKVYANKLVVDAIKELSEYTKELRKYSTKKELFLIKNKSIHVIARSSFEAKYDKFIKRWDIRDANGELYHLRSHQFRATFVRELVKKKIPIAMVMKQFSHVSVEMTAHYLSLEQEEIKEIYSDMILSPNSKIAGLRAKEIRGKLDELYHGKTADEIDEVVTNLAKSMSFNPLPTGVCLYDVRRGNCSDGDGCFFYNCPNYITEAQFYPVLKAELDLLDKEMARLKELGHEREWQKQYIKYKYLKPLVESLEVQINGKEEIG